MIWIDAIITFMGFAVPCLFLVVAWWVSTPMALSTATLTFGILATLGMDNAIPMFGKEIVGGSTYLPAMFMSIAFCARAYGVDQTLDMIRCASRGMALFAITEFRWIFFALYSPEHAEYSFHEASNLGRNAVLMTCIMYFGGIAIVSLRKLFSDYGPYGRMAIPVYIDTLIVSPISILSVFSDYGNAFKTDQLWYETVFWTVLTRLSVPAIVISIIYVIGKRVGAKSLEEQDVLRT